MEEVNKIRNPTVLTEGAYNITVSKRGITILFGTDEILHAGFNHTKSFAVTNELIQMNKQQLDAIEHLVDLANKALGKEGVMYIE